MRSGVLDALFGYTGFVGSNLATQHDFQAKFNSRNTDSARDGVFGTAVFAAAPAEKWRANQNPEADLENTHSLIDLVRSITAERFVLVSTVDVYPTPVGVNEHTIPDTAVLHPYGLHRLYLEQAVREAHPDALIIRLPGLFGPGLKKNVIYDLMYDNQVELINPGSVFQYYDVTQLWELIQIATTHHLPLVNLVSEPVSTAEILEKVFPGKLDDVTGRPGAVRYDVRTVHADLFGGTGEYTFGSDATLQRLRAFVEGSTALGGGDR